MKTVAAVLSCFVAFYLALFFVNMITMNVIPFVSQGSVIVGIASVGFLWLVAPGIISYYLLSWIPEKFSCSKPENTVVSYVTLQLVLGVLVLTYNILNVKGNWDLNLLMVGAMTSVCVGSMMAKSGMISPAQADHPSP